MIIDARTLADGTAIETTVCIVGAGAAGLTLACHLRRRNIPLCVVEAGGFDFDKATQHLACGESAEEQQANAERERTQAIMGEIYGALKVARRLERGNVVVLFADDG